MARYVLPANLVIEARKRQNFNLIVHLPDAFDMLDRAFRLLFQHGLPDLPQ